MRRSTRIGGACLVVASAALLLAGCGADAAADGVAVSAPGTVDAGPSVALPAPARVTPERLELAMTCTGNLRGEITCDGPLAAEPHWAIIGGQGTNVLLASELPTHVGAEGHPDVLPESGPWSGTLFAQVTIRNLMVETMLAPVDVFFRMDPYVPEPEGVDSVEHCLDTPEGDFDGSMQHYFRFDEALAAAETSARVPWCFEIEAEDVATYRYRFTVLVSAELDLPDPASFVVFDFSTESRQAVVGNGEIARESVFAGTYAYTVSERSIRTSAWQDGAGEKAWELAFSTAGFEGIRLSSQQRGSSTGPRDFQVQYRVGEGEWTDVPGGDLTLTESFTGGTLDALPLPAAAADAEEVSLRWVMTSNLSIRAGDGHPEDDPVQSAGTSRIRDIVLTGSPIAD